MGAITRTFHPSPDGQFSLELLVSIATVPFFVPAKPIDRLQTISERGQGVTVSYM